MGEDSKTCYTCSRTDRKRIYNLKDFDTDNITYFEKLKYCITSSDLLEHKDMMICWICVKHLRISFAFRETVLKSQNAMKQQQQVVCTDLDELVKLEFDSHSTSSRDLLKNESERDDNNKNESLACSDSRRSLLDALTASDNKAIEHRCECCDLEFPKRWQLKKHFAREHNTTRKYTCPNCNKEFKQMSHLKEHATSHTGEKNYSCPICEKKFQRLSSQRRHLKTHDAPPGHKTKRTPFLCTICGKSFPFSNGVQRHMRIHFGIKNFQCELCKKKFSQSTHLQVHMRTHTGEKPYICDTCGETFSIKSCMIKHVNNRHLKSKSFTEDLPIFYLPKEFDHVNLN